MNDLAFGIAFLILYFWFILSCIAPRDLFREASELQPRPEEPAWIPVARTTVFH